jgi:hypothetical protein
VQLTEECSAAILDPLPEKNKGPRMPHNHVFNRSSTL